MEPILEPTAGPYSPLFELRAWRRELDQMVHQYADDAQAMETISRARREVGEWIRARARAI